MMPIKNREKEHHTRKEKKLLMIIYKRGNRKNWRASSFYEPEVNHMDNFTNYQTSYENHKAYQIKKISRIY